MAETYLRGGSNQGPPVRWIELICWLAICASVNGKSIHFFCQNISVWSSYHGGSGSRDCTYVRIVDASKSVSVKLYACMCDAPKLIVYSTLGFCTVGRLCTTMALPVSPVPPPLGMGSPTLSATCREPSGASNGT